MLQDLIDNLASTGTNISDNDSAIANLGSLPKSYEVLVVFISGQTNSTLESVISLLLEEEIWLKSKGRDIEDEPQIFYSNKNSSRRNLKFAKRKFETTNKTLHLKKKGNYFQCDKTNHIKDYRIFPQDKKAKFGHQANSVLNTKLFTMALTVDDTLSDK